ncbi:hypothetical protein K4L06_06085 [Lysobacter sp. BMK333-48F3]|uniref:hypothetical protein n=1 Tax=Lysobacter sp. BMK333-48F3 TaxID=2867962 RepID=UPI001C8C4DFE|nr:hypothetical protein [Lysobacter sp. BMK333-48F3]MBX9400875.1 hypothetical protein [Lysobacter sp. BMK333-48F3]
MQNEYIWFVLTGVILGGQLLAWGVEALFARYCYFTGIDHGNWWWLGVVGWATIFAYWLLLAGAFALAIGAAAWALVPLGAGAGFALFVVLRFRRYWRRRGL